MSGIRLIGYDIEPPTSAPSVGASPAFGTMGFGSYQYKVTYVSQFGETTAGIASIPIATTTGALQLTNIPTSTLDNLIARKVYRTSIGNTPPFKLLTTIPELITTIFTDTTPDVALGADEPIANFASSVEKTYGWIGHTKPSFYTFESNVLATGTTHATAAPISPNAEFVLVDPVIANNGVLLPPIQSNIIGLVVVVKNNDNALDLSVYAFETTSQIGGSAPTVAFTVPAESTATFMIDSVSSWNVISIAGGGGGGGGVTSLAGTVDQVVVDAATGAVTISLPQSIATTSTPTFNQITVTNAPAVGTDATNKLYVDTAIAGVVTSLTGTVDQVSVSAATGAVTISLPQSIATTSTPTFNQITVTNAPLMMTDAANKLYVDAAIAGLTWKSAAEAGTTTPLTVVYDNGTAGVGATLTNAGVQAALVVDSYVVSVGDRVLVKDQVDQTQNGIYDVTDAGSGGTNWVLTRSLDADNSPANELDKASLMVMNGTVNTGYTYTQITPNTVIGVSNNVFTLFLTVPPHLNMVTVKRIFIPNNYNALLKGIPIGGVYRSAVNDPILAAVITASFVATGTVITVTGTSALIVNGMQLSGGTVGAGVLIAGQLTGLTGGIGTYSTNISQAAGTTAIYADVSLTFAITSSFVAAGTVLTVTVTAGVITAGMFLNGGGVEAGTQIIGQLTGTVGAVGTYSVDTSNLIAVAPTAVEWSLTNPDILFMRTV